MTIISEMYKKLKYLLKQHLHYPALQHQEHFQLWQQALVDWVAVQPSACFVKATGVMVSELQSDICNNQVYKFQFIPTKKDQFLLVNQNKLTLVYI